VQLQLAPVGADELAKRMLVTGLDRPIRSWLTAIASIILLGRVVPRSQVLTPEREKTWRAAPGFPFRRDQYP